MLSKERVAKILKLKGEVRGDVLKTDFEYILKNQGEKDFKKLNQELKKINAQLDYYKIKNTSWLPVAWKILLIETAKNLFNWQEKDFFNLGYSASTNSFIIRTLLRYFVSLEKTFKECPKYWQKYWAIGELEPYSIDLEKKVLLIRLKDFNMHPDLCLYMTGHFKAFAELILRTKEIKIQETKCSFQQDKFHEFKITW